MVALPRVIGHRGAAAHAPENTLGGLALAAELGCSWVEFDVRLARDDVPVVVHDRNLVRTTGLDQEIDDVRSRQLAGIDAGSWFDSFWSHERIPTLSQALDACVVLGLTPNVEIKGDGGARRATALAVVRTIRQRWPAGRASPLISSFSLRVLYHVRSAGGGLPLGLLMSRTPRRFWSWHAAILGCASVHLDPSLATPGLVARIHRTGRKVAVYTVNDVSQADELFDAGVDAIFSDAPDLMARTSRDSPREKQPVAVPGNGADKAGQPSDPAGA